MDCEGALKESIDCKIEEMNFFYEKKNYFKAREKLVEAWNILPADKYIYSESYWISVLIVDTSLKIGDLDTANDWINCVFKSDRERIDDGEREMWAGKIAHASNNKDLAKKYFMVAFEKSGGRCFLNENQQYLEYIKNISTNKDTDEEL